MPTTKQLPTPTALFEFMRDAVAADYDPTVSWENNTYGLPDAACGHFGFTFVDPDTDEWNDPAFDVTGEALTMLETWHQSDEFAHAIGPTE